MKYMIFTPDQSDRGMREWLKVEWSSATLLYRQDVHALKQDEILDTLCDQIVREPERWGWVEL